MGCTSTGETICQHQNFPFKPCRSRENKPCERMNPNRYSRQPGSHHTQQPCFWGHRMHHRRFLPHKHIDQPTQRDKVTSKRDMPFHRDANTSYPKFLLSLIQLMSGRRQQYHLILLFQFRQHPCHENHRHRYCTCTDNFGFHQIGTILRILYLPRNAPNALLVWVYSANHHSHIPIGILDY